MKDTLEKSILQDLPVIRPNQTAIEMIRRIEILVEHCSGSIFPSTQGEERSAEDWEKMPRFYLILWLEVVHEERIQRHGNQDHRPRLR